MFTVSASPKIKFMQGSKLRPWIIPAGLDFHVISPPSDGATYLDVGVQFGAGVEYEIIPGLKFGIDGRYHLVAGISNTENNTVAVLSREIAEDPVLSHCTSYFRQYGQRLTISGPSVVTSGSPSNPLLHLRGREGGNLPPFFICAGGKAV